VGVYISSFSLFPLSSSLIFYSSTFTMDLPDTNLVPPVPAE
jgi:hypothetical protein